MAKRKKRDKHPKRRGPGGPVRPIGSAPSRRVTPPGTRPDDAPTEPLVDAVLDGFGTEPVDGVDAALRAELGAADFLDTATETPGDHVRPMLAAVAGGLAQRRTAHADLALAALARVGPERGHHAFARSWERRASAPDTHPVALALGHDEVTEAIQVAHVCGDGINVMVGIDNPAGPYSVAIYIDHNLGGMAKDALIGPPIGQVRAIYAQADEGFTVTDLDPGVARAMIDQARWLTDHTLEAPVNEDYETFLPLVQRRIDLLPTPTPQQVDAAERFGFAEVSQAERIAHIGAFMASPEFAALPAGMGDEASGIAGLWIDHAVDYAVGEPRRVSPVLVELFCMDWFPRKVAADAAMVAAAAPTIEAWLRFAARTTALDDRWLAEALDALEQFSPGLAGAVDDPASWGLAKSLLGSMPDEGSFEAASWLAHEDTRWEPLEAPGDDGGRLHVEGDPSGVDPWLYAKTKAVAAQVTTQAAALLGPSFAQPAMDLAIALGSVEPSPYERTQAGSWPGAIVWLLADDNDAFQTRTVGRRRNDLADALPMTRPTYEAKVKKIRAALGLGKGDLRVDHR